MSVKGNRLMIELQTFKDHVLNNNMMDLERMIQDVMTSHVAGKSDYAMFDGGAHKGFHTLHMLRLPGCARVYAVEADPFMAETLRTVLDGQALPGGPDLTFVKKALVGDASVTEIAWKSSSSHVGRSSIVSNGKKRSTIWQDNTEIEYREAMTVPAITIDTILAGDPGPVPFLKLDLEGADLISLRGARQTLTKHRPLIAFENSIHAPKVHGFTIEEMMEYFTELNYVPMNFVGQPMTPNTWFGLFEAMAAPREHADWLSKTLQAVVGRRLKQ